MEPLRTDILDEWRRRCVRKAKEDDERETTASLADARRLSALLRRAAAASLKQKLTESLRHVYESNKPDADPQAEALPIRPDGQGLHDRVLSDSLVRLHVRQDWDALWQVCPDNPHRLDDLSPDDWRKRTERTAQQRAAWLVDTHLPGRRKTAGAQTDWLLGQLQSILRHPFDPDILPPLPGPDATPGHAACEYSAILRITDVRTAILKEWQRRYEPDRAKAQNPRSGLNSLLRLAAGYLTDTAFFDVVQLSKSALRAERKVERQQLARAMCGAEQIKVRALWNTRWNRETIAAGECFRLPSLVFLTTAHEWAMSNRRDCEANRRAQARPRRIGADPALLQKQPLYEPADKSPASRRARTCWHILELLGDVRLGRVHGNEEARLSLNAIVQKITGRKDGPRYRQISKMVEQLRQCGFVSVESRPSANGKIEKRIAILKYPPRIY